MSTLSETTDARDPVRDGIQRRKQARRRGSRRFALAALVVAMASRAVAVALVPGDERLVDGLAALLSALVLALWVAWSARRHGDEARPLMAFFASFALLFALFRLGDWIRGVL